MFAGRPRIEGVGKLIIVLNRFVEVRQGFVVPVGIWNRWTPWLYAWIAPSNANPAWRARRNAGISDTPRRMAISSSF